MEWLHYFIIFSDKNQKPTPFWKSAFLIYISQSAFISGIIFPTVIIAN